MSKPNNKQFEEDKTSYHQHQGEQSTCSSEHEEEEDHQEEQGTMLLERALGAGHAVDGARG
jgi:hypothetical protein